MTGRTSYLPGRARGGRVEKADEKWTLVLVRELRHAPELVWQALTDPAELAQWAPFDADHNLGVLGPVQLTAAGAPTPRIAQGVVKQADEPRLLHYSWGDQDLRWELEPTVSSAGIGTRLTLWHNIDRRFIAWGAAGWHICLDVFDRLLEGDPLGRIVGSEAMSFDWQRLNAEYAEAFGIESPRWET